MTTTTTPYTVATRNGHPDEGVWVPNASTAADGGFLNVGGLLVAGVGEEGEYPTEFVILGTSRTPDGRYTWTDVYRAAEGYMKQVFGWRNLMSDPDLVQTLHEVRPRQPKQEHVVFLRHPHPDHPCACEWDGQWRMERVDPGTDGAVAVTTMARPGARR